MVIIEDGDTIVVVDGSNRSYEIRLQGIDAPEGGQAFGNDARESLSQLVSGKEVTIEWSKRDRYRRIVGKVMLDDRDICLDQIKAGMAWHYKYYQSEQSPVDRQLYTDAEVEARTTRRGLWSNTNPTPPWSFRQGH